MNNVLRNYMSSRAISIFKFYYSGYELLLYVSL